MEQADEEPRDEEDEQDGEERRNRVHHVERQPFHRRQHERPHRLAPRTCVGEPAENEADREVRHNQSESDRDERHEPPPEFEQPGGAEHLQLALARARDLVFGSTNQPPGDPLVAPRDRDQQDDSEGDRQQRQPGGPQEHRRRSRLDRFRQREPQRADRLRGLAVERVSGQLVDVERGQSDDAAVGDDDDATALERSHFHRPGQTIGHQAVEEPHDPRRALRRHATQHSRTELHNRAIAEHHRDSLTRRFDTGGGADRRRRRRGLAAWTALGGGPGRRQNQGQKCQSRHETGASRVPPRRSIVTSGSKRDAACRRILADDAAPCDSHRPFDREPQHRFRSCSGRRTGSTSPCGSVDDPEPAVSNGTRRLMNLSRTVCTALLGVLSLGPFAEAPVEQSTRSTPESPLLSPPAVPALRCGCLEATAGRARRKSRVDSSG